MYIIEYALLNLVKNKGRNILSGVIIFAVITAAAAALAIYNASGIALEETKTALQCAVRIMPQRQTPGSRQIIGGDRQEAMLSFEQYISFAESLYLDGADIKESGGNPDGTDAVYYLKQPDMLTAFESELRVKGLPESYSVRTDESAFESIAAPVENLKELAFMFLIIILILGVLIMILLSLISIRERKYEVGVLRAMGMKKKKVAFALLTEIIAVTCVFSILGMGAGALLSQPVSDAVLIGQAQSDEAGSTSLADRLSPEDASPEQEKINVSVSAVTALEIFAVSILLAAAAGIIAVSHITKSEPIKILMERN